ncbi:hypothetical protein Hamer_G028799 [Homarus americanus]|uniref:Uncharacterized protein n=1 Tax=Homarus americanus TaxID=6706 RepID=A0A8J5KFK4_HOMAM|nr:hypothetical protein Hamer_G028799 [Homarus americanus]
MVAIQRGGRSRCWKGAKCCNQSPCAACAKRAFVTLTYCFHVGGGGIWANCGEERVDTGYGDVKLCNVLFEGRIGVVSGSDGGRASGYSATEMGAKGGASGVGYVPRGKSKEGDDQVLCIYLGGYEERKRHVDDGAGNNRGGCSLPRDSVFVGELFEQ